MVTAEDLQDSGRRHVNLVMALKIETHAHGPVTTLLPNPQDHCDDFRRDAVANHGGPAGPVRQAFHPILLEAAKPNVILRPTDAEKAASLADVVRYLLCVLEHAKTSLDLAGLLLLELGRFIPDLLLKVGRIPYLSGMSISSYRAQSLMLQYD
jgi:hypothetical protein